MSATPAPAREQAHRALAEALRRAADMVEALSVEPATGPRLVVPGGGQEVLLTVREAAQRLGCSVRHVERLVAGKPCRRRFGRSVRIELSGLLALAKRG